MSVQGTVDSNLRCHMSCRLARKRRLSCCRRMGMKPHRGVAGKFYPSIRSLHVSLAACAGVERKFFLFVAAFCLCFCHSLCVVYASLLLCLSLPMHLSPRLCIFGSRFEHAVGLFTCDIDISPPSTSLFRSSVRCSMHAQTQTQAHSCTHARTHICTQIRIRRD